MRHKILQYEKGQAILSDFNIILDLNQGLSHYLFVIITVKIHLKFSLCVGIKFTNR